MDIRDHDVVILDFSETVYMDDSAALVVEQMIDTAIAEDTECLVMGLKNPVAGTLDSLNILQRVPADHVVADLDEARETAKSILTQRGVVTAPETGADKGADADSEDASAG